MYFNLSKLGIEPRSYYYKKYVLPLNYFDLIYLNKLKYDLYQDRTGISNMKSYCNNLYTKRPFNKKIKYY
jgi:hypothetical protein